jgi:hypothetical protein
VSCLFPVALRRLTGISPTWPPPGTQATVIQVDPPGSAPPATGDHSGLPPTPRPVAGRPPHRRQSDVVVGHSLAGLGRVAAGGRQPRSGRPLAIAGSDPADAAVYGGVLQAARCLGPVGRHRCADRRFPSSRPTVRAKVIGSPSAKVCVHFRADAEIPRSSHHPLNSRPRYPLYPREAWRPQSGKGRNRAATPRSRPAPPPPGPSTARGVRNPPPRARGETGAAVPGFAERTLFPGGCPVLSS